MLNLQFEDMTRASAYRSHPALLYPRGRFELSFHQPSHMDIIILLTFALGENKKNEMSKRWQKSAKNKMGRKKGGKDHVTAEEPHTWTEHDVNQLFLL